MTASLFLALLASSRAGNDEMAGEPDDVQALLDEEDDSATEAEEPSRMGGRLVYRLSISTRYGQSDVSG